MDSMVCADCMIQLLLILLVSNGATVSVAAGIDLLIASLHSLLSYILYICLLNCFQNFSILFIWTI